MLKFCLPVAIALFLAGCAGSNVTSADKTAAVSAGKAEAAAITAANANQQAKKKRSSYDSSKKSKDDLHCVKYKPTGSHRSRTRCVTQEQRQQEEDAARMSLDAATGPTISPSRP